MEDIEKLEEERQKEKEFEIEMMKYQISNLFDSNQSVSLNELEFELLDLIDSTSKTFFDDFIKKILYNNKDKLIRYIAEKKTELNEEEKSNLIKYLNSLKT